MIIVKLEVCELKKHANSSRAIRFFASADLYSKEDVQPRSLDQSMMNDSIMIPNQGPKDFVEGADALKMSVIPKALQNGSKPLLDDSLPSLGMFDTFGQKVSVTDLVIYRENKAASGGYVVLCSHVPITANNYTRGEKIYIDIQPNLQSNTVKLKEVKVKGLIESVKLTRIPNVGENEIKTNSRYVYEIFFTTEIDYYMENRAVYAVSQIAEGAGTIDGYIAEQNKKPCPTFKKLIDADIDTFFSNCPGKDVVRISNADFSASGDWTMPESFLGSNYNYVIDGRSYMDFLRSPVYGMEKNFIPYQSTIDGKITTEAVYLPYTDYKNMQVGLKASGGFKINSINTARYSVSPNSPENKYFSKQVVLAADSSVSYRLESISDPSLGDDMVSYKVLKQNSSEKNDNFEDLIQYFIDIENALNELSSTSQAKPSLGIANNSNGDANLASVIAYCTTIPTGKNQPKTVAIKNELRGYRLVVSAKHGCRFTILGETFTDMEKGRYFRSSKLERSRREQAQKDFKSKGP